MTRAPNEFRPARAMHIALAKILENDLYLWMTRAEFVDHLNAATGGTVAHLALERIYDGLMREAGLDPFGAEIDAPIWKNYGNFVDPLRKIDPRTDTALMELMKEAQDRIKNGVEFWEEPPRPVHNPLRKKVKTIEDKLAEFKK